MPSNSAQFIERYIAGRLRGLRHQLGIAQSRVAEEIGVTFQQVQKYEAGINRISAGRLFMLARLFGVSVQEFFPKSSPTSDGRRKSQKLQEMSVFAASPAGQELYDAFLRVKDAKKRKIIISLVREMAKE